MAQQEIPIEVIERAGPGPGLGLHIEGAMTAIIRHAVDIGTGGGIGFGRQQAAIGEKRHAMGIGQFHPVEGIGIDRQIPGLDLGRGQPGQQGEIPRHHQALDMVGIGVFRRIAHHIGHAVHRRLAAPVEPGQGVGCVQGVALAIGRHLQPVKAPDIFPPADDLADEALCRIQGHLACPAGRLCRGADFARIQQAEVQGRCQQAVVEKGRALFHRILVIAEPGAGCGR